MFLILKENNVPSFLSYNVTPNNTRPIDIIYGQSPVEVTVFAPKERFWRPFFCKKQIILNKRRGNSMKQKLLKMIQVTGWLHTDEFIFVWFYKNENGRQNRSLGAKTEFP